MTWSALIAASAAGQGALTGMVTTNDGQPLATASVRASRASDRMLAGVAMTDSTGAFRIGGLGAGAYVVTVHRVGYRNIELSGVMLAEGETRVLQFSLLLAPRHLTAVDVVTSPTVVDAAATEVTVKLDRSFTALLPSARSSSSLLALLPGSRKDQVWGGAAGVSNNYRLDGIAMNHPGLGGEFLSLSVDWMDAVEVKGPGAGAEYGDFQGGVISARTKSGSNVRTATLRTNYESARLTESNFNYNEQGAEQAGRREVAGEAGGPVLRDQLFYFAAGQFVSRDVRAAPLASGFLAGTPQVMQQSQDSRGMFKLTWLPKPEQRTDFLFGAASARVEHDGVNGIDAPDALSKVSQPAVYGTASWTLLTATGGIDARVGGYRAWETRTGYLGEDVPGIQVYQSGRQPQYQNAPFTERRYPSGVTGTLQWRSTQRFLFEHQLTVGADLGRSSWRNEVTRNGGLTWRPYTMFKKSFDPATPAGWASTASDWGGEAHINAVMSNAAVFAQDNVAIGKRVTLTPGLRLSHWTGTALGPCGQCTLGESVTPSGIDPRLGISWDVTGRGTFAVKVHAGRYHQGMSAFFFDRAKGANTYTDASYYPSGPAITDPRTTFTTADRDSLVAGFPKKFELVTLSESGRITRYRQPYVDQVMVSVEKSLGPKWKVDVFGTIRTNRSIVGLVDRNMATNYTAIHDVRIDNFFFPGSIKAPKGGPLVIPTVYFANYDLKRLRQLSPNDSVIAGYDTAYISTLQWNPDYVLTSIPGANREYRQATIQVRTIQSWWRGEASFTAARLEGNVAGVTGYGAAGGRFTPGPFARPNEAFNIDGILPDAQQLEGKLWLTARLWAGFSGGALYTHTYGETYTPEFRFESRYSYRKNFGAQEVPTELLRRIMGQSMLLEQRGSRHYPSRDVVDLHLEWKSRLNAVFSADLFNALGIDVPTLVNTNVGDRVSTDPTTHFNAVRERVQPRTVRLGVRLETGERR